MSYVLGSGVSKIFAWMFVLCSVGASRRCYLGTSDSHLLLSWAGSGWCDMTPDIGQTQLRLSLLRRESRAAVLPSPLVLLDNDPLFADRLETALRVSQIRAGLWGKLGNLLCLLPPLPRDVTVSSAQGGLSAATHSSVSHQGGRVQLLDFSGFVCCLY